MGQLANVLRDPKNRRTLRVEGGQFEYGDPTRLIEDLLAIRQTWADVTILVNDNPARRNYGYLAFWGMGHPRLDFTLPYQAVMSCSNRQVRELFERPEDREHILRFVERQANFEADPEPRPEVASSWARLLADDLF